MERALSMLSPFVSSVAGRYSVRLRVGRLGEGGFGRGVTEDTFVDVQRYDARIAGALADGSADGSKSVDNAVGLFFGIANERESCPDAVMRSHDGSLLMGV